MSHRDLDDMLALRRRIEAIDLRVAASKRELVVDLRLIADLKRGREEIAAHLARYEKAKP